MTAAHRTREWHTNSRIARKIIRARLEAGDQVTCTNCGRPIQPDQRWDVGHIVDAHKGGTAHLSNLGGAHRRCNRADGGRAGARARAASTRRTRRLPTTW